MTIENEILCRAHDLGFATAGVARAGPAQSHAVFADWLAQGKAAGMDYLARHADLRADPRRLAPATISIIVVAARYPVNRRPGHGVSTYARGHDYHTVLRAKLKALAAWLKAEAGVRHARVCVDSAPLLEREWAVRAGIGWRGKQGQIVNEKLGCCLLLGVLLVDIELTPTASAVNRCGTCTRCLDACPTGALDAAGLVDARRCIAYLTIEHKGEIPAPMRPLLGHALFGCDGCTAVCPWNRFGEDAVMPELAARPMPTVDEIMTMTEPAFDETFRDTPLQRTGLAKLRDNATLVLARGTPG